MGEITVATIGDSSKLHTGFAQVMKQINDGFMNASFNLYHFGILDWQPDINRELPYPFWPTSPFDPMGKEEVLRFVQQVEPDIVWIMIDPGNLLTYAINLIKLNDERKKSNRKTFKILAYPPVEGKPLSMFQATAVKHIMQNEGEVVFWCDSAAREAEKWLPEWTFEHIYFGADHADFRPYTEEQRHMLRYKVGLDKYFAVGSFGVNKRTKGFATLIYAATCLKEWGYEDKIRFYCHTDPFNPVMQGHHLVDMADRYGVKKMFLWKPDNNQEKRGNAYLGNPRSSNTLIEVEMSRKPRSKEGRMELWSSYDFISKMNCMDLYCDVSQVEGAGLPQLEAMACGVPLISVHDQHVRDEWYGDTAYMMEPLSPDLWETWHTGARLVTLDPLHVAQAIDQMYRSPELRELIVQRGLERMTQFKWADTQEKMVQKVKELYARSVS